MEKTQKILKIQDYKQLENYDITEKMWQLYVAHPHEYIYQNKKGVWSRAKFTLNNMKLLQHLKGSGAYGVFAGHTWTKFICFDVDMGDNAKWYTMKLVSVLVEDFGVRHDDIHISFSGKKGYHVEIFFDKPIPLQATGAFYEAVIAEMVIQTKDFYNEDKPLSQKIEYRPQPTQGIGLKLPLGIHQETKKRCWFVDTVSLKPITQMAYIHSIHPMSADGFLELIDYEEVQEVKKKANALTDKQKSEHEMVAVATNIEGRSKEDARAIAENFLHTRQMDGNTGRHNLTHLLAILMNEQGASREGAIDTIEDAMLEAYETQRNFFDPQTTREKVVKEISRLVDLAMERDYRFQDLNHDVLLSKTELIDILSVKDLTQKHILYAMTIHSKRKAKKDGTFFMAYSTINDMTGLIERGNIKKHIEALQKAGKVEIVSANVVDKEKSKAFGQKINKPNVYKVTLQEPQEDEAHFSIKPTEIPSFLDIVTKVISEDEVKKIVTKSQYYNTFKPMYQVV